MSQFDEVADQYDENLTELLGTDDVDKYAEYKIQLLKIISERKNGRILDFGCGTGKSLKFLNKYFPGCEIKGCDVSASSLDIAAHYIGRNNLFVNEDTEALKNEGPFDLIFAACVFHHISPEERRQWIEGIVDALAEGGMFFIFEHNVLNPMTKKIILSPLNLVDDINWMLSHEELKAMCTKPDNVSIVWDGYTLFSPWRPDWMTSFERVLKWLPIGAQHCVAIKRTR